MAVFPASELLSIGVDPDVMLNGRVGCPNVGVECGGWGHIVMQIRVEDRKKMTKEKLAAGENP